jgi:hypothetical protein
MEGKNKLYLVCGCNNHMLISPQILYTVAQIDMKNLKIKLNGNCYFITGFQMLLAHISFPSKNLLMLLVS